MNYFKDPPDFDVGDESDFCSLDDFLLDLGSPLRSEPTKELCTSCLTKLEKPLCGKNKCKILENGIKLSEQKILNKRLEILGDDTELYD